jgi:hypothetical protein
MRRSVNREAAESKPYLIWNAFVDLLAMEEYADLSEVQRRAHLVFWYDSEVQNGGHLQYFLNRGTQLVPETLIALEGIGLPCQASVLRRASARWVLHERPEPQTAEEYSEQALEGEFDQYDAAFHACAPPVPDVLEQHLKMHRDEYVNLV